MILRPACLAGLVTLAGCTLAQAMTPLPHPPQVLPPSPLLFVRVTGPQGMRATFYQGRAPARSFPAPVVVGMRTGYLYRVQLSNLPGRPGLTLFPTLQVRGSLHLSPQYRPSAFPATVHLNEEDIDAVLNGSMITKLVYLEHPDRAEPQATRPGEVLQTNMPPRTDLYNEAVARGRPVLVVHLGERVPTAEELARQSVANTILYPDEKRMGLPAGPPTVPLFAPPFYDPFHGPRPPEEECLHDGGDRGIKAGLGAGGELHGVDPEDTVAQWTDCAGRRHVTCSNRVCLCVPRFAVLRCETPLLQSETVLGPTARLKVVRQQQVQERKPPIQAAQYERLKGYRGRLRPGENVEVNGPGLLLGLKVLQAQQINLGLVEYVGTKQALLLSPVQKALVARQLALARELSVMQQLGGTEQVIVTSIIGRVKGGPEVVTATASTRDLTVCCHETPCPPDKPLVLIKCADRGSAQVGDVVTFSLRYSNVGGRPITDVAVTDSLSGRLEYVPGSAESDRDAVFTMQENEAGSVVLRWEITGTLLPGQTGRLRFKARVR
jgi:uncharacterized repeat protein (TIGR01451 family)